MLAVVEDHMEIPPSRQYRGGGRQWVGVVRCGVAVADVFEIPLSANAAVRLVEGRRHIVQILGLIAIGNDIALVVMALLEQPLEYSGPTGRICQSSVGVDAVQAGNVVFGNGSPEGAAIDRVGPMLDPGKQAFNARPISLHRVHDAGVVRGRQAFSNPVAALHDERRDEIFHIGEDEDIRFLGVPILGKPLVRLAGDGRRRKSPSQSERTITGAGVVRQRQSRTEAARRGGDGQRHRRRAGDRVGAELFADAVDCPATLRQRDRRNQTRIGGLLRLRDLLVARLVSSHHASLVSRDTNAALRLLDRADTGQCEMPVCTLSRGGA